MNNIFQVREYLDSINAKENYKIWELKLENYSKDTLYLKKENKTIDKNKLLNHLKNLKYILFGNLPKQYGGIGEDNLLLLKSSNPINEDEIYQRLFHLIITKKDIVTPLCNCCRQEYSNKDKGWKTTKNKEKEYFKDNNDVEYIGSNYLHICPKCHFLLKSRIPLYNKLNLEKFNKNVFLRQSDEYIEYQPICFKLLQQKQNKQQQK